MKGWNLAVDFGTTFTCAAVQDARGAAAIEVQNERRVPSAVMLAEDGTLRAGAPALQHLAHHPDRVERTPKRHLGRTSLLLGETAVPVPEAVAAVLALFLDEGRRLRGGSAPEKVVLTHPAGWGGSPGIRTGALRAAADIAGMARVQLLAEPVAAAVHFVDDRLRPGEYVLVYDLGGGTFDTAVLRKDGTGFELVGLPGGDEHVGGEVLDHRLYELVGARLAEHDDAAWQRIRTDDGRPWQQARADLRTRARQAKEQLSAHPSASLYVLSSDREITVTRDEFEALIHDDIAATVDELERTVQRADLAAADIAAVYLVGGSSRIPLVGRLVTERFGDRVVTWDEPKSVVALGAAKSTRPIVTVPVPRRPVGSGRGAQSYFAHRPPVPAQGGPPGTGWQQAGPPPTGPGSAGPAAGGAPGSFSWSTRPVPGLPPLPGRPPVVPSPGPPDPPRRLPDRVTPRRLALLLGAVAGVALLVVLIAVLVAAGIGGGAVVGGVIGLSLALLGLAHQRLRPPPDGPT